MDDDIKQAANAALGKRIGAAFIDLILLFIVFVIVGAATGNAHHNDNGTNIHLHGGTALLFFVLAFGYYFATEATMGATLGKKVLGLAVIGSDGEALTVGRVAIRTVLRIVDVAPFLYLIGLLTMIIGSNRQRVGDMVAKTVVVPASLTTSE